jgi:hypothetical protein
MTAATSGPTPDPQTVREITATAISYVIRDHLVQAAMAEHGVDTANVYAWSEIYDAVLDALATTVSRLAEQPQDGKANSYVDSHSPWSEWLTSQLLDRGWLASDLVKASGHMLTAKQVSRWLHSQEVPEPGMAAVAGKALGGVVIGALYAAGHGDVADGLTGEAEQPQQVRDGDEASAAERVRATIALRADHGTAVYEHDDADLTAVLDDLTAVLDNREVWRNLALSRGKEREQLAARVEELKADRDGDLRVVHAVFDVPAGWLAGRALHELYGHFVPRFAELDQRNTADSDGSGNA